MATTLTTKSRSPGSLLRGGVGSGEWSPGLAGAGGGVRLEVASSEKQPAEAGARPLRGLRRGAVASLPVLPAFRGDARHNRFRKGLTFLNKISERFPRGGRYLGATLSWDSSSARALDLSPVFFNHLETVPSAIDSSGHHASWPFLLLCRFFMQKVCCGKNVTSRPE